MSSLISRAVTLIMPALVMLVSTTTTKADEQGVQFFEQKIRPVLVEHCYGCHSVEAQTQKKLQGELFLDSSAGIAAGGETGPALIKGNAAESLLLKAMKYDGMEMPPNRQVI